MGTMIAVTSAPSILYVKATAAARPMIKTIIASVRVTWPEGRGRSLVRATFASKSRSQISLATLDQSLLLLFWGKNLLPQTKDAVCDLIGSKDAEERTSDQSKRQILLHGVEEEREPCRMLTKS